MKNGMRQVLGTVTAAVIFFSTVFAPVSIAAATHENTEGANGALSQEKNGVIEEYENYDDKVSVLNDAGNSGILDVNPPELISVELLSTEVTVPGEIEVVVDAKDDISGISTLAVNFKNAAYKQSIQFHCSLSSDGKYHGTFRINQYGKPGKYEISSVYMVDGAGNNITYSVVEDQYNAALPKEFSGLSFIVYNGGTSADLVTLTETENLAKEIEETPSDAEILVDYSKNGEIKADTFDAIRGSDRKLTLESEGVQWIFCGKDIVNESKAISLDVKVEQTSTCTTEDAGDIGEIVGNKKSAILTFKPNGVLPGKAKIRIKLDYLVGMGTEDLFVYYYDTKEKKMLKIAENLTITADHYLEFEIEHCSQYVVTEGELDEEQENTKINPENDFTWNGNVITGYVGTETDIVIPAKAVEIGEAAFSGKNITSLSFEEGSKCLKIASVAFSECQELTTVSLPQNIETIGESAFTRCDIREIIIPETVVELGGDIFYDNRNLSKVTILASRLSAKRLSSQGGVFIGCNISELTLSDKMEYIPDWLFKDAGFEPGTEIIIPASVKKLGYCAFAQASNLSGVTLPEGLITIDQGAFADCDLKEITIPSTVKYILGDAFAGNRSLHKVTILSPSIICKDEYYHGDVFRGCSINEVIFSEEMQYIPDYLFQNATFETGASIVLPPNIKRIGKFAFNQSKNLRSITFPLSLESIDLWAFFDCTDFREIKYAGTQTSWQRVVIIEGNDVVKNPTTFLGQEEEPVPVDPDKQPASGYDPVAKETSNGEVYLVKGQTHSLSSNDFRITTNNGNVSLDVKKGIITAKKSTGTTGAVVSNGKSTLTVYVAAPSALINTKKTETLFIGETANVAVNGIPESQRSFYPVAWASANSAIASVDPISGHSATITAVGKGSTKITATIGGKAYTCTVKVKDTLSAPPIIGAEANISLEPMKLTSLKYSGFNPKNATWVSTNADNPMKVVKTNRKGEATLLSNGIVRITVSNGKMLAVGAGDTTIVGTDTSGRSVILNISVKAVSSNPINYVRAGKKITLKAPKLALAKASWSIVSGGEYVATVRKGVVTAASSRPRNPSHDCAVITARYKPYIDGNGFLYTYNVYVETPSINAADGLQMNKTGNYVLNLNQGDTFDLAKHYQGICQNVMWKSSKPAVAFIDNGVIHANSIGVTGNTVFSTKISGVALKVTVTVSK